ncbi:hypothetical protein E4U11_007161 [Claviceps purpurea]|nr:hypothetical protein E4U11_007161 [Claviceps purpurea]
MHDKDSQAAASICPRLANLLLSRCQGALVAKLSADDIWGTYVSRISGGHLENRGTGDRTPVHARMGKKLISFLAD